MPIRSNAVDVPYRMIDSMVLRVPFFRQTKDYTCGPACIRMLLAYHGKRFSERHLARAMRTHHAIGTRKAEIIRFAKRRGLKCHIVRHATWRDVSHQLRERTPVMVTYREPSENVGHYALVTGRRGHAVMLHDPWNGKYFRMSIPTFKRRWLGYETRSSAWGWMATLHIPERADQ